MPSFFERLFGRRANDTAPDDVDQDVDDDDLDDDPDDEAAAGAVERRYLEFVGGTSAKFYAIVLHAVDDAWTVQFNFGRIGHPRDWGVKVEDADENEAREAFDSVIEEKIRGGYEPRSWPPDLEMPEGLAAASDDEPGERGPSSAGLYVSSVAGTLPPASGAVIAGIQLPPGVLVASEQSEASKPVIWISQRPVADLATLWRHLASAFSTTGLWPLIMALEMEPDGMAEIFFEPSTAGGSSARAVLANWWTESTADGEDTDAQAPFGRRFPGLAQPTPGDRPSDLDDRVAGQTGHLGLVAARRPADVLAVTGWTGAANYDADPGDQSTVLRSWEERFDAYLVGLGWDTVHVAVGRPPRDRDHATAIAAEHLAFCPDNIWQGPGSIRAYHEELIDAPVWGFWWD